MFSDDIDITFTYSTAGGFNDTAFTVRDFDGTDDAAIIAFVSGAWWGITSRDVTVASIDVYINTIHRFHVTRGTWGGPDIHDGTMAVWGT